MVKAAPRKLQPELLRRFVRVEGEERLVGSFVSLPRRDDHVVMAVRVAAAATTLFLLLKAIR